MLTICKYLISRTENPKALKIMHILQAVREGRLGERTDTSVYQGDFHRIISRVNVTLDVVCRHFDAIPDAIAFFGPQKTLLYCNESMNDLLVSLGMEGSEEHLLAQVTDILDETGDKYASFHETRYSGNLSINTRTEEVRSYSISLLCTCRKPETPTGGCGGNHLRCDNSCMMLVLSDTTTLTRARDDAEFASSRSEERRVGKECRSRWSPYH